MEGIVSIEVTTRNVLPCLNVITRDEQSVLLMTSANQIIHQISLQSVSTGLIGTLNQQFKNEYIC